MEWNFLEHLNDDPINTVEPFESIGYNLHNQRYPSRDDKSLMSFYNDSFFVKSLQALNVKKVNFTDVSTQKKNGDHFYFV